MINADPEIRDPSRAPTHPGAILREDVLPALDISVVGFAEALGVSRQTVHAILAERSPVTPEMAVRVGKVVGNGPGFWLGMQQALDLWKAERQVDVSGIRRLTAA